LIATLRRELLDRILVVSERHLRQILTSYLHHFNAARPHRTLGQLAPAQTKTPSPPMINLANYQIRRTAILDGLSASITAQHDRTGPRRPTGQDQDPISEPYSLQISVSKTTTDPEAPGPYSDPS
jgi:hypothetical protein